VVRLRARMLCPFVVRVVALLLLVAAPAAADPRVLFRSGQPAADGTVLATLENPHAAGAAGVAVRGTTSALFTRNGDALTAVARTGDALPAPLAGTFDTFETPVITATGAIAFHATLNATSADDGIFLQDGATVLPVVVATADTTLGAFDANAALTVAYVQDDAIFLWDRTSMTSTRLIGRGDVAPGGGVFRRVGRIALNDGGTVAFAAVLKGVPDGVFTASLTTGPHFLGRRRFGPGALSINAAGQVAFASDGRSSADMVVRYEPTSNSVTVVGKKDDVVGGVTLTTIDPEFVAIDPQGRVAFEARVDAKGAPRRLFFADAGGLTQLTDDLSRTAAGFAPRLTASDRIVWTQDRRVARFDGTVRGVLGPGDPTAIGPSVDPADPSINDAGTVAFTAAHEALYLVDAGAARPVVRVGDKLVDGSVITAIGAHGVFDDALVFVATLDGIDPVVLLVRGTTIDRVVSVGDVTPTGGTFATIGDVIDVGGDGVVFNASVSGGKASEGVFRASLQSGRLEVLATSRGKKHAPRGFSSPTAAGDGAVFRAVTGNDAGLFSGTGGRARRLVEIGQEVHGIGGRVTGLREFASSATGTVVAVTLKKASALAAVLLVRKNKVTPLLAQGDSAPGGGAFDAVDTAQLAMSDTAAAVLVPLFGAGATSGLFLVGGGGPSALLLDATAVPGGGVVALAGVRSLTIDGTGVLLDTQLTGGAGAARALVAVP